MTNAIQVFSFEQREVRVIERDGEPWFVAKDVCNILDIQNHRDTIAKVLDDDERGASEISTPSNGGHSTVGIINEPGLYKLIMRCNKPEAKPFQRWVTHDVLPSIRKTGGYTIRPDKAKHLELAEGRLNAQRARLLQRMIERPEYPITDDSKRVLIHEVTRLTTGNEHPEILPDEVERLYSAKQLGELWGITNRAVHKIANVLGIKPNEGSRNEYAVWKMSKSPYSSHECSQLFFTEAGRARLGDALSAEGAA
ncbi:MAG: Bro-N domain-containing protein [Fretibacterium sp.]|nr:Bro-N domain-containing protein [Fretibacterium sp.]